MTTYLTTAEAAVKLGVTPGRVRQLIQSGELTADRRGRDYLIDPDALAAARDRPRVGWPKGKPRRKAARRR